MKITKYTVKTKSKRNFRAAFVADTHDIPYHGIIDEIKKQKADVILLTGDIIYGHDDVAENGFKMLYALADTAPTFMCLGNHESDAVEIVRDHCKNAGVRLLEEDYAEFEGVKIGGITSGYISDTVAPPENHWQKTPPPDLGWLESFASLEGYKILLNHHPEYYPEYIQKLNVDLTLSGHAHGGQWRIFGRGIFAPGQGLFPKYTSGIHDGRFIISRGMANNAFVPRIFNPCELIFIDFVN